MKCPLCGCEEYIECMDALICVECKCVYNGDD